MERSLLLETSGRQGQVALAAAGTIVAVQRMEAATKRASDLAIIVQQLLGTAGWVPRDVQQVIVGLGPGSFTGLRVGLASAKALAYALGCAFVGVESFAAILPLVPPTQTEAIVVADALQGNVFSRHYRRVESGWQPLNELMVQPKATLNAQGVLVTGPGAGLFEQEPNEVTPASLLIASSWEWACTRDVWRAEPLYVRGSSAEEKRQQMAKSGELGQR